MPARRLRPPSLLKLFAIASLLASNAWGYAEEQTDPTTLATVSTHHLYLTRALAVCAGFDYAEGVVDPVGVNDPVLKTVLPPDKAKAAEVIAFNDEMTDVGTICTASNAPCTGNACACDPGAARCRLNFAWQLLQACVANANAAADACLPDVTVPAGDCPAAGQVRSCPGQAKNLPVVPACPKKAR
jgi:hypothetical protein